MDKKRLIEACKWSVGVLLVFGGMFWICLLAVLIFKTYPLLMIPFFGAGLIGLMYFLLWAFDDLE